MYYTRFYKFSFKIMKISEQHRLIIGKDLLFNHRMRCQMYTIAEKNKLAVAVLVVVWLPASGHTY
jgi:hypothetical protein